MKLSTRAKYGLRAMICLAQHDSSILLSVKDIAQKQHLPEHYLEQIISPLRKSGLVEGVRGAGGGYRLTRPAASVTVLDVLEALDGPIDPAGCSADITADDAGQWLEPLLWHPLRDGIRRFLAEKSLKDVAEQAQALSAKCQPVYYI